MVESGRGSPCGAAGYRHGGSSFVQVGTGEIVVLLEGVGLDIVAGKWGGSKVSQQGPWDKETCSLEKSAYLLPEGEDNEGSEEGEEYDSS